MSPNGTGNVAKAEGWYCLANHYLHQRHVARSPFARFGLTLLNCPDCGGNVMFVLRKQGEVWHAKVQ